MKIDSGDTAWVLASAALVMLMTPALGFFYGGLVRRKNVLSTIMHSFFILCLISVQWVLWGYSLAFGPDKFHLIGGLEWVGLNNVGFTPNPDYAPTIPHQAFMVFQMMFAVITPALISGAFAERKRFKSFVLFSLLWSLLVYVPVAHWVWGVGGWIRTLGALDFAGGTVVHITSGVSALVCALVMGKRVGYGSEPMEPHNITMTVLGAGILWFGWFGFNAGSALGANGLAGVAFVNTNTATAAAMLGWILVEKLRDGHSTTLGAASGAVAGLVAITPAAGFVSPVGAIILGLIAGAVCSLAVALKYRLGYDDALDVVGVHLVGGVVGALLIGFLGSTRATGIGIDGLFYGGGWHLLKLQAIAVGAAVGYSFVATLVIAKAIDLVMGLRITRDEELEGMDTVLHAETAYDFGGVAAGGFSPHQRAAAGGPPVGASAGATARSEGVQA